MHVCHEFGKMSGLIISNLLQVCCLVNIGINPLRINKSGLMEYRFVERAFLKRAANEGCRPENGLLQTAPHELCINKDRRGKADKGIIFLFKPAVMPPGAAKGDLVEPGALEFTVGKNRETKRTEFPLHCLKGASGEMASGKKRIPDFYICPCAILIMSLITQDMVNGKVLKAGTLRPEIAAASFLQLEGLERTINQTSVREIPLR